MNLARIIDFRDIQLEPGRLTVAQYGDGLPFPAKRFFLIWAGHREANRGGHANLRQSEMIICIGGRAKVVVDDRAGKRTYLLGSSRCGVYAPPMTWTTVALTIRSTVLVLASDLYDEADRITDLRSFEEAHATA